MSMQDPIADMFCQIMNGQARSRAKVIMPSSKLKIAIVEILVQEGYVSGYSLSEASIGKKQLEIELKYFEGKPVIELLKRISKPGLRRYKAMDDLPEVLGGYGTAIISTSKGVMTDKSARVQGVGGELLCIVA